MDATTREIIRLYEEVGKNKVSTVAHTHLQIDLDVHFEKEKFHYGYGEESLRMQMLMDEMQNRLGEGIVNLDPETRTKKDLLVFIALLELMATNYRDEITDGAYNEKKIDDEVEKATIYELCTINDNSNSIIKKGLKMIHNKDIIKDEVKDFPADKFFEVFWKEGDEDTSHFYLNKWEVDLPVKP